MGKMLKDHGRSRAQVLDGNHGIEKISYGSSEKFLPWYFDKHKQGTYYYTRVDGWYRIECGTWLEAFDHIARSRRMLTSKHIGSNYAQEAKQAGVELPESQAKYGLLVSNVGWVRQDCLDYREVKSLFDEYAGSKQYEQVTMWSSEEHDPIEESYLDVQMATTPDDLFYDPWHD